MTGTILIQKRLAHGQNDAFDPQRTLALQQDGRHNLAAAARSKQHLLIFGNAAPSTPASTASVIQSKERCSCKD
jgi:hypothetical protein